MDDRTRALVETFTERFGAPPIAGMRAPGRVNLIGEHTDYNDGFCLPMAIERDIRIALRPRADDQVCAIDVNMDSGGETSFTLSSDIARDPDVRWADYLKGCAQVLIEDGLALRGCDLALSGDVPLGSGLSSSAALEIATMLALLRAADLTLGAERLARLAQRAENAYVGTNCGILDQLASACGMEGSAMLMDCRSLALSPAPLPAGVRVVIADTGRRRGLVDSAYNERRSQCEAGARALGVSHLRDIDLHALHRARVEGLLDELSARRCEHVVAENGRTLAAAACLHAGNAVALGQLMDQSHADLRDRFAVTCPELDDMVTIARGLPGCLGSRMTGAGFGGSTVSLVLEEEVERFIAALIPAYRQRHELPAEAFATGAAPGGGVLRVV
ncbi:MAG: galactokinase [Planctomycetota bacterium]